MIKFIKDLLFLFSCRKGLAVWHKDIVAHTRYKCKFNGHYEPPLKSFRNEEIPRFLRDKKIIWSWCNYTDKVILFGRDEDAVMFVIAFGGEFVAPRYNRNWWDFS